MLALLFVALIAGVSYGQNVCTADVAIFGNSCTFTSSFEIVGQNVCSPGVQAGCYVLVNCGGDAGNPSSLTMSIYDNANCDGTPLYPTSTITPGSCQQFSTCALGQSYASMSQSQMAACCGGATSESKKVAGNFTKLVDDFEKYIMQKDEELLGPVLGHL